jgi:mono/diheme cytochrome c family protein
MRQHVIPQVLLAGSVMLLSAAVSVAALARDGSAGAGAAQDTSAAPKSDARIARGEYLVKTMGCHDCHTPHKLGPKGPERDMSRALTGHPENLKMPSPPKLGDGPWAWVGSGTMTAFAGPWGVSFTANLTPDPETGLGNWTEDMFMTAMRTGRHEGKGRPILPPMPYFVVSQLVDDDMRALFAYLKSLKPVKNRVPQPIDPPEAVR